MVDLAAMHAALDTLPSTNASAKTVYAVATSIMSWVNAQTATNWWSDWLNLHTAFDDSANIKKLNAQVSAIGAEVQAVDGSDSTFSDYDTLLQLTYQCAVEANAVEEGTNARADNLNKLWADIKTNATVAIDYTSIIVVALIVFAVVWETRK